MRALCIPRAGFIHLVGIPLACQVDNMFFVVVVLNMSRRSSARNQPHTKESQSAATHKLSCVLRRSPFKVAVKHCRSANDGQCEEDKLNRNDLGGVKALECAVDVFDLHDCSADQNGNQEIEDGKRNSTPERIRK